MLKGLFQNLLILSHLSDSFDVPAGCTQAIPAQVPIFFKFLFVEFIKLDENYEKNSNIMLSVSC